VKSPTRRGGVIPLSCKPPLPCILPPFLPLTHAYRVHGVDLSVSPQQQLACVRVAILSAFVKRRVLVLNERHSSDLSLSTISCSFNLIFCLPTNKRVNKQRNQGGENDLSLLVSRFWKNLFF
jgi:hypothetical protein